VFPINLPPMDGGQKNLRRTAGDAMRPLAMHRGLAADRQRLLNLNDPSFLFQAFSASECPRD